MYRILTVLVLLMYFTASAQQVAKPKEIVNSFQIVDEVSKKAVASVSVTILRAELSITTEKDGIFNIGGDLSKMRDTVVFELLGYLPSKMALKDLHGRDTISLVAKGRSSTAITALKGERIQVNEFKAKEIVYYAGLNTTTANFDYLQLAQRFDVEKAGGQLGKVVINRLWFNVDYEAQADFVDLEYTTFRLRIYSVDASGKPGKDLCDQTIEMESKNSHSVSINLDNYGIRIPDRSFFVAIEWMRDHRNVGYGMVMDKKTGIYQKTVNFRPAIGVSPIEGKRLNIWAMTMKKKWVPYSYFMPEGTDLAITATVLY